MNEVKLQIRVRGKETRCVKRHTPQLSFVGLKPDLFTKKTDFDTITDREIKFVQDWINSRPMKVLGYLTPTEAFLGINVPLAC